MYMYMNCTKQNQHNVKFYHVVSHEINMEAKLTPGGVKKSTLVCTQNVSVEDYSVECSTVS